MSTNLIIFIKKTIVTIIGLALFALGSYLSIQANVGLAPWDAFSKGLSNVLGISFGSVVIFTGVIILIADYILGEKIGVGTVLNTILIGIFTDIYISLEIIPIVENIWVGIITLLAGQTVLCIGSYFYIKNGLGCGPRDSLMVALSKRMSRVPVGLVRGLIEGSVLIIGWLLGAKIGIGTIISVFGISFILEITFKVFKFKVKDVKHDSLIDSFQYITESCKKA